MYIYKYTQKYILLLLFFKNFYLTFQSNYVVDMSLILFLKTKFENVNSL